MSLATEIEQQRFISKYSIKDQFSLGTFSVNKANVKKWHKS